MAETLDGFVIQGPGHPIQACFHTFAPTMTGAWRRHIGHQERPVGEFETMIGRWRAKGWRPVAAKLSLEDPA